MRKKLLLVLIAATGFCTILIAQQQAPDSLMKLLRTHTQEDTARINLLNELAQEIHRSNPKLCDSLVETALQLSGRLHYGKGRGRALTVKAIRNFNLSEFTAAGQKFDSAKLLLQSVNDIRGLTSVYRAQATLFMEQGNYAGSLELLLRGLTSAQQSGDLVQVVEVNRTIGYLYNIIGDYKKAIPYQTDALKQAQAIDYKIGIAMG